MASKKLTWLGDNVTKTLEVPGQKPIRVGGEVTLTDAQIKALRSSGHVFADPKSEEAQSAADAARKQTPATPPTGGTATT